MSLVEVHLRQVEIAAHHFHGGMSEEILEGERVTVIPDEFHGKGVPEAVGVGVADLGAFGDFGDDAPQTVTGELVPLIGDEQGVARACIGSFSQVTPDRLGGAGAHTNLAFLLAFTEDV